MTHRALNVLFTCITLHLNTGQPLLIWDIHQILYQSDEISLAKQMPYDQIYQDLGYLKATWALGSAWKANYQYPIRQEILDALGKESREPVSEPRPYYCGQQMPPLMLSWFLGHKSSQEAENQAQNILYKSRYMRPQTHNLARYIVPLIFDPNTHVTSSPLDQNACDLVKSYNQRGITSVAFTNTHNDFKNALHATEHGKNTLSLFSHVYSSHDCGMLKPRPTSINAIARKHNVHQSQCIVIDAEHQHYKALRAHCIPAVHYTKPEQAKVDIDQQLEQLKQS